jgi:primosomal replication protein N
MKNDELFTDAHSATYCPEDDKLRLYVGRVPRDEYEALRAEGWTSTPKQDCDFVAVWTTAREDTALSYAGIILDEDQGPADRAADRAERFTGYLEKRLGEATGHADRYDAGPSAHGFQSQARADRSAARHDRHASRAVNAWGKAEYWTSRTAGVISNALYKSAPAVRMGRIKTIEAELRKAEKNREEYSAHFRMIRTIAADPDKAAASYLAASPYSETLEDATCSLCEHIAGHGKHRNPANLEAPAGYYCEHMEGDNPPTLAGYAARYLETHTAPDSEAYEETSNARFINHCKLRLAYESQMLEAQGGRAAMVEMEAGGFIGNYQIQKVNKSPATGRTVSVQVIAQGDRWGNTREGTHLKTLNIERLSTEAYRAPTEEEKAAFLAAKADAKKNAPKSTAPPLINPTDEDAERLQAAWNSQAREAREVIRMTQAEYSARSGGTYAAFETVEITGGGKQRPTGGPMNRPRFPAVAKVRCHGHRIIIITDKPRKPLPAVAWHDPRPETIAEVQRNAETLRSAARKNWLNDMNDEEKRVFELARLVGIAYTDSMSQFGITPKGNDTLKAAPEPAPSKRNGPPTDENGAFIIPCHVECKPSNPELRPDALRKAAAPAPTQIETPKPEKPAAELSPVIAGAMATLENLTQAELFA